ncbi:MAG: DMT family transporter [Elainellaceae cyanobacterium]
MVFATAAFSSAHAIIRYVSQEIHPFEIGFFRTALGLIPLIPWCIWTRLPGLQRQKLGLYTSRAGVSTLAMMTFFLGVSLTPLAEASALNFSAPLFASAAAILFLREKASLLRWFALGFGFLGALVILRPGFGTVSIGGLIVLLSSFFVAWVFILIKLLSRTESSLAITVHTSLLQVPMTLLIALPVWHWPNAEQTLWMLLVGSLSMFGQIAMTQSFKEADVTKVLPFQFFQLIWAVLIGYTLFAEIPDLWTWVGGVMIFLSSMFVAVKEAKLEKPEC